MRARLRLDAWNGITSQEVLVVGETPRSYRVQGLTEARLAGRHRWLKSGQTALVPKHPVTLLERARKAPMT